MPSTVVTALPSSDQMHLVEKYLGREGVEPRLDRLSGSRWQATKERARKAGLMKVRRAGGRLRIKHSKEYKAQTFR